MVFQKYERQVKVVKWEDKPWIDIDEARGKMKITKDSMILNKMATFLSGMDLPSKISVYFDPDTGLIKISKDPLGNLTLSPNGNNANTNARGFISQFPEVIGDYTVRLKGRDLLCEKVSDEKD